MTLTFRFGGEAAHFLALALITVPLKGMLAFFLFFCIGIGISEIGSSSGLLNGFLGLSGYLSSSFLETGSSGVLRGLLDHVGQLGHYGVRLFSISFLGSSCSG